MILHLNNLLQATKHIHDQGQSAYIAERSLLLSLLDCFSSSLVVYDITSFCSFANKYFSQLRKHSFEINFDSLLISLLYQLRN